jgi:cytochrome c553
MMRRIALALVVTAVAGGLALMSWDVAVGQTSGAAKETASPKAPTYAGVTKCKMCHNADNKGAQYKVWAASPHAQAFATLATPEAAEVAKKAGVTGSPQQAPQCLECHTTGFKAPAEARAAVKPEDGVSCEECHGPGSDYQSMTVMKAIFAGTTPPASVGLLIPDEKVCLRCHNEKSPTFKPFDYKERLAKIAHPYPAEFAKTRGRK